MKTVTMKFVVLFILTAFVQRFTCLSFSWNGKDYSYYTKSAKFADAASACAFSDAHLAMFKSEREQDEVLALMDSSVDTFWLGSRRESSAEEYKWLDGTEMEYSNWVTGERRCKEGKCCVYIARSSKLWNTFTCTGTSYYLCQRTSGDTILERLEKIENLANETFNQLQDMKVNSSQTMLELEYVLLEQARRAEDSFRTSNETMALKLAEMFETVIKHAEVVEFNASKSGERSRLIRTSMDLMKSKVEQLQAEHSEEIISLHEKLRLLKSMTDELTRQNYEQRIMSFILMAGVVLMACLMLARSLFLWNSHRREQRTFVASKTLGEELDVFHSDTDEMMS